MEPWMAQNLDPGGHPELWGNMGLHPLLLASFSLELELEPWARRARVARTKLFARKYAYLQWKYTLKMHRVSNACIFTRSY